MIYFLRHLTGKRRTEGANRQLGLSLAFVAGATNAGGFMAVNQYTSHMTGIVSSMADYIGANNIMLAVVGGGSVIAFIGGAAFSSILINWGKHHHTNSAYAYPLLWEAALLLCFGLMGGYLELHQNGFVPVTVTLLCFIMGLQNAIITKISNAEIRTTHMTGIVTDIGIEIGKIFYINSKDETEHYKPVHANFKKLRLLIALLALFFFGGVAGAFGFKYVGYSSTLPLSVLLVLLAIVPIIDDMRTQTKILARARHRHRDDDAPTASAAP